MRDIRQSHHVRLLPEVWQLVTEHSAKDGCRNYNEYIEKAIRFYSGYKDVDTSIDFLDDRANELIRRLDLVMASHEETFINTAKEFGNRMGHLLFKVALENDMMMHIIAADTDIDLRTLKNLRRMCVNDVIKTRGEIGFSDVLEFQKRMNSTDFIKAEEAVTDPAYEIFNEPIEDDEDDSE